jgi:hypothetical protein
MTSSADSSPHEFAPARATAVQITDDSLSIDLADGRRLTVPLNWFPVLASASRDARSRWELVGDGIGIHWPDADEDISVAGLLAGQRAPTRRGAA